MREMVAQRRRAHGVRAGDGKPVRAAPRTSSAAIRPSQKTGIAMPEERRRPWPARPRALVAGAAPLRTPSERARSGGQQRRTIAISSRVAGSRSPIIATTGRVVAKLVPRSPRRAALSPAQVLNGNRLIHAETLAVGLHHLWVDRRGPRRAGCPRVRRAPPGSRAKRTIEMPKRSGTICSSRRSDVGAHGSYRRASSRRGSRSCRSWCRCRGSGGRASSRARGPRCSRAAASAPSRPGAPARGRAAACGAARAQRVVGALEQLVQLRVAEPRHVVGALAGVEPGDARVGGQEPGAHHRHPLAAPPALRPGRALHASRRAPRSPSPSARPG